MTQTTSRKPDLPRGFIPAREAAARLGVRRASLYAYVSRGAVRVVAHPTDPRARLYAAADIEDLIARKARGRRPAIAAATALDWGLPVLTTAISRIAEGHLFYRDVDAVELSGHASLEDVASLLWQCARNPFVSRAGLPVRVVSSTGSPVERAVAALNPLLPRDNAEDAVQATAIVRRVVASAIGKPAGDHPIHAQLAAAWDRHDAADTIRRALVLAADHELNAS
ncbi:MAG TPA: citrate synthase, partial [Bauldia sp.]|nr:citrate synthase [Bauldia sp.]